MGGAETGRGPMWNEMLRAKWDEGRFVCVGLDSEYAKIPASVKISKYSTEPTAERMLEFNRRIVVATQDIVLAYKPNLAFYEAVGSQGIDALKKTVHMIRCLAPGAPVILDAKRADIGNTNAGYVQMAFEYCGADAITIHPYLGMEAVEPFLAMKDKGVIVLCKTSNKGSGEFQDRLVVIDDPQEIADLDHLATPAVVNQRWVSLIAFYKLVAYRISRHWNKNSNCSVVVGATYPEELAVVRQIVGDDMPILIPGIGTQGGDVEATVKAGQNTGGQRIIINASRSIIFASGGSDFAEAARSETLKLHNLINQYRN